MKTYTFPWTCPACDEKIPDAIPVDMRTEGSRIVFSIGDAALTDVAAHIWTHSEAAS